MLGKTLGNHLVCKYSISGNRILFGYGEIHSFFMSIKKLNCVGYCVLYGFKKRKVVLLLAFLIVINVSDTS